MWEVAVSFNSCSAHVHLSVGLLRTLPVQQIDLRFAEALHASMIRVLVRKELQECDVPGLLKADNCFELFCAARAIPAEYTNGRRPPDM
eukprot:243180-Prymnesium_polylepis.1